MKFKVGHLSIVRGLKLILLVVGALTILKYGAIPSYRLVLIPMMM